MIKEEMKRRRTTVPVTGIKIDTSKTKEMRIRALVPRFEWGRIFLSQGLIDLEMEYSQFPRGSHDDLMDSLAYMDQIVYYPRPKGENSNESPAPNHPDYEKWYIKQLFKRAKDTESDRNDRNSGY